MNLYFLGSARVQKEQLPNPMVGFPADCMPTEGMDSKYA